MKLEWWVEANFCKKPGVRDDLTVIGTPKLYQDVTNRSKSVVKSIIGNLIDKSIFFDK